MDGKSADVIVNDTIVVVQQGSFAFFPKDSFSMVLSPDFTRCVGLVIESSKGILVGHATEHDASLLKIYRKMAERGDIQRATFILPDLSFTTDVPKDSVNELARLKE